MIKRAALIFGWVFLLVGIMGFIPALRMGGGEGYDYPHDRAEGVSGQELLPAEAADERFLELSDHGDERELAERLRRIREARDRP